MSTRDCLRYSDHDDNDNSSALLTGRVGGEGVIGLFSVGGGMYVDWVPRKMRQPHQPGCSPLEPPYPSS